MALNEGWLNKASDSVVEETQGRSCTCISVTQCWLALPSRHLYLSPFASGFRVIHIRLPRPLSASRFHSRPASLRLLYVPFPPPLCTICPFYHHSCSVHSSSPSPLLSLLSLSLNRRCFHWTGHEKCSTVEVPRKSDPTKLSNVTSRPSFSPAQESPGNFSK